MNAKGLAPLTAISIAILLFVELLLFQLAAASILSQSLSVGFYNCTCPRAEEIVRQAVENRYSVQPSISPGLIRLHFHDCIVRGCDASILLDETPTKEPVEKSSPANGQTLRGLEAIDDAKLELEAECPGTVSCADILAFAARDAAVLAGLSYYPVPSGRRDGTISRASEALANLPSPFATMTDLTAIFARKGFNQTEMVVLSGAHSFGGAHCYTFGNRLYNFAAGIPVDPSMDPLFADALKMDCPEPTSDGKVEFDPMSPLQLDGSYYKAVENGRGLLSSDQVLMTNKVTRTAVKQMSKRPELWAAEFTRVLVKLGAVDVLVGSEGEVRNSCRFVN